jgi:hypothetical protein
MPQWIRDAENVEDETLRRILLFGDSVLHRSVRLKDCEKSALLRKELQCEELRRAPLPVGRTRNEPEQEWPDEDQNQTVHFSTPGTAAKLM